MRFIREALAFAALAFQIGVVWFFWSQLPAQIPTHFGISGTPDDYGAKSNLVVLPAIAMVLYGLLTAVSFFPRAFNYPIAVTDENRDRLQAIAVAVLGWLKAEITWAFAYITWVDIRVGLGVSGGLGWAFLPLMLGVVGVTVAIGVVQTRRAG
jgi:Protein of unknown function (DUF1648)